MITLDFPWNHLSTPGYCWYNNDADTYKATYGALYNWYAVKTGKICPTGWHMPTDVEWTKLTDDLGVYYTSKGKLKQLGSYYMVGGKLKETGTTHWNSPNNGATNEVGFTALPSGIRNFTGEFSEIGYQTEWWSSIEYNITNAWKRRVDYSVSDIYRINDNKKIGFSVRCVKDQTL